MNRFMTKMIAALALGGAVIAAAPAEARRDGHWGHDRGQRWDNHRGGDRHWRGDRRDWRGDRYWRGDRGYYSRRGYYAPRYYGPRYYSPRYYGYGYGHHYRDDGGDVVLGALAGIAIGAAIASD